ncbi:hypothetical protein ACIA8O_24405 [Kitasatospora sp. NPDC051853]|uniref:hypothetical protein n=1 Tax=Kitasatospora sp. NPDC051853 TaxID=3364058 RepID=UPI0037BAD8D0
MLAGGLVACGTVKQLSAADKVSDAFGKVSEGKSFKAEVGFDATADQILAFDKAMTKGKKKSEQLDRKTAELMAGIKLSVAVASDKPLKDVAGLKDGSQITDFNSIPDDLGYDFAYAVTGKDGALADLRYVDGTFYAKADVEGIAKIAGEDTAELKQGAAMFPKVIQDALGGKWVSVDTKTFKELAQEATKASGTKTAPSAAPSVDPKVASNLVNTVKDVISRNVTFEDKGKHEGADHIYVAAPAKAFADDLLKSIKPLAKDIPGFDELPGTVPSDFPDQKVGVDVYIKDGALSGISLDLAQFEKDAPADAHMPIKVTFTKDAEAPKAPAGATAFTKKDFEDVMGAVMGAAMGGKTPGGKTTTGTKPGAGTSTLTDAQIKELAALGGVPEAQIKLLAQTGMTYDQLKAAVAG